MGKFALVATVGIEDKGIDLSGQDYEKTAKVSFHHHGNKLDVSWNTFLRHLKKLKLEPSEIAMDLLVVACTMYAADTRISRSDYGEDSWTRVIDLYIPVSDPDLWDKQKTNIQNIFKFLTGDVWTLTFRPRSNKDLKLCPKGNRKAYKMPYQTDTVCLFSGGMDSFIGAIDLLEQNIVPLLIGHSKSADVSPFQKRCGDALTKAYATKKTERIYAFIKIPKSEIFDSEEHTERGRSFLFLTLGAICASSLGTKAKLIVPENGMISLNIPLTPLRVGSHSTRTTHPQYFEMMQKLFDSLNLEVTIKNPYQFKTKGEMLKECKNSSLVVDTETMSCSHPSGRYAGLGNIHCGYCVPCIIRRASYKASGLVDKFNYRLDIYDSAGLEIAKAEGADIQAFKFMIAKVKKHPMFLTALIRATGSLGEDVDGYIDVYRRSLQEVENLVSTVKLR
ncbi:MULTISPECIES: Qat anti-phage system QueC-like protein QatC [Sphingobacterium]|uniref:Qat anti-phage system QueC-like protein QatC n=1 Tax=Sphingobacterium TaxID=28453 RepID=UPI00257A329E|nr:MULTISPECIES: Qat anti-phage system QueC-like protein QatC [Sphingobacterium]